jgi:uncharacterized protein (TIGR03435 family)
MNRRILFKLLLLAAGSVMMPIAFAQAVAPPQWQTDAGGKMAFEVASIRLSKPGTFTPPSFPLSPDDAYSPNGGVLSADFPLGIYLIFAYKIVDISQYESLEAQMPKWAETDSYTIHAKAEGNPTKDQMRLMVQALLADRFKLAVHFKNQEVPVLAATLIKPGKLGPKLRAHVDGPPCDGPASTKGSSANGVDVFPSTCGVFSAQATPTHNILLGSRNSTMAQIVAVLPTVAKLNRPGVDRTGLSGRFDFTIEWTPERNTSAVPGEQTQAELQGTTIYEALKEQLGLKLESTKASMEVLVVDHVERPSEN